MSADTGEGATTGVGAVAGDTGAGDGGAGAGTSTGADATDTGTGMRTTTPTGATNTSTRTTTPTGATNTGVPTPPRSAPSPRAAGPRGLDFDKLYAARLQAARARPYLASALFALHVVECRRVPTMGVDRYWRCYVSPDFVDRRPVEELAGVWVHEVSHLLRDHHGRSDRVAKERGLSGPGERLRMNIAADCEINDDAFGDGLVKPEGAVDPASLRLPEGQLMEDYLRRFQLGPRTGEFAWLDCGSGADGLEREWELGADGAHGLSEQERDAVRFRVARGITGRPGSASAGWKRWAEEAFHPPQPWRELLGAAVRSAASAPGAGEDYSYGRPSRRSAGVPGTVLPSLRRRPPHVSVIIDTSGSVSDAELGSALLEVAAISRAVGGRRDLVTVVPCDAAARIAHPLCKAEGIPLLGGGGTNLRAGFTRALRSHPRPDVIVALTDGQTPWPASRPPCRTVVGLFPRHSRRTTWSEDDPDYVPHSPPAWARVVEIG
ncbi:vWA domain-containing protein [Streptomyces stelliscabiei]|uniref:vWA domain-containing protein n=1 Tax=Streptomyces stelliscabiei TaxID=146820 RepID=UPI0029A4605B|nr:VWA-like domain-containing protein [Streptomyces stelliscabiei]MDX2553080.1 VWA-like domain-containing protein [Streptomyces stelliscabiei]MDX2612068.1 VWA-like domain-containing protein [Streptomyces stelliscabiei]MDX2636406.1 VWA-like domain-containing protein [Streptomyces stelliscabiei]MDX2663157.1 VWA-like domain-containing protein [Streptomyces stelliscabiei]MDX2714252.1 VWA-like domain-containing protein [Streptomyces stelliscabiei]